MTDLWTTLIPLAIASAVLPVQVAVTILMLRSSGGRAKASGWVGGMTVVRLAQWLVVGVVLGTAVDDEAGAGAVEATLLLVVAIVFLVSAGRKLASQPDEDAAPPRWMARVGGVTPVQAFAMGALVVGLSPKLWAFTLGAIGAIVDANLGAGVGLAVFGLFAAVAAGLHLAAIGFALVSPSTADVALGRVGDALERHSRPVMIALSLGFGAWFLLKSLSAFGIL